MENFKLTWPFSLYRRRKVTRLKNVFNIALEKKTSPKHGNASSFGSLKLSLKKRKPFLKSAG